MVFSSTVFLFVFLPAVWLLHTVIPQKQIWLRNAVLGIASLIFYAYGEPVYIIVMLLSILINYLLAEWIQSCADKGRAGWKKGLTVCAVCVNLLILCFFKYLPWLIRMMNAGLRLTLPVPQIEMPIGVSFYTFQILSYVLDVSKGGEDNRAQDNFFYLLLYISFFPQLIAGPIVTYGEMKNQLYERRTTLAGTALGIRRFLYGLSKKLLIANSAAVLADAAFGSPSPSCPVAWIGAAAYCLQIYFDFSGYSDMAIGLASMFGFTIRENFLYPYAAVTIRDFWKRWHISLTTWFREYVYIPLGGNRVSPRRTAFNRYLVFFLTGLWHGADFTYILWGLWHGTLMMLEQALPVDRWAKKAALRPLFRLYTALAVLFGFVLFRAENLSHAGRYLAAMFTGSGGLSAISGELTPYLCLMLAAGILFSAPILPWIRRKAEEAGKKTLCDGAEYVITLALFGLCIMTLASSSFNPFIYYIF